MKTKTIKTFAVLITAFAVFTTLNSCQKEKVTPPGSTTTAPAPTVNNFTFAYQGTIDGLTSLLSSNKNAFKTGSADQVFGSCGSVTLDTTTLPYTKTWNFGTGCTGSDGHTRSGQIVVTFNTKNLEQAGDTISVAFNNYQCDTVLYGGGLGMTTFTDGGGYLNYDVAMNASATIGGTTYPETGNLNWQWIAGMNSSPAKNVQFSVTGALSGYDKNQNSQVITITNPLLRNYATPGCDYLVQGNVVVVTNGSATDSLNYLNSCSGTYTETINGKTTTHQQ